MARKKSYHYRKRHKPGTPPGTLTPVQNAPAPIIHVMSYGPDQFSEVKLGSAGQIRDYIGKAPVVWVNVDVLDRVEDIQTIGEAFGLHSLALEDTVNVHQRPKTEDYESNIYTVCRMADDSNGEIDLEQISIFMGKGFVVSFQEAPGDCWGSLRDRLRKGGNKRLMTSGADYLLYALLDAAIDDYFPFLEKLGDQLDALEVHVLDSPGKAAMVEIQKVKKALHTIRHAVWPMRESIGQIMNHETLVDPGTLVFLRDCQDHVVQVLDIVESYRERVSGLMDIYLSSMSNHLNEVMRFLAVISTIFMPLTFIVGVYGMNFDTNVSHYNMPELEHPYGYPIIMALMLGIAIAMVIFFYRAGWFGNPGYDESTAKTGEEKR